MKETKLLALFGKSGAGKDTIQSLLLNNTSGIFHRIVSCTTRPPREGEMNGVDYHYLTREAFLESMMREEFIEALEFNGWFYGARVTELNNEKINIGIFTPKGINSLFETASCYNLNILPLYIYCSGKERLLRALNREESPDCAEICRRFGADEADFAEIDFPFFRFGNDKGDIITADKVPMMVNQVEDFFS